MRRFVFVLAAIAALAFVAACGDDDTPLPSVSAAPCPTNQPGALYQYVGPAVMFGNTGLSVEIADTESERATGLMNRPCLDANTGMIFVYPHDVDNAFWMENTLIPLSIAWVTVDGTVLGIDDMLPQTKDLHFSPSLYRYAIEANQGWFAEHGIVAGDVAILPANLSGS